MRRQLTQVLLLLAGCGPGGPALSNGDLAASAPADAFADGSTIPDAQATDGSPVPDAGGADQGSCAPTPGTGSTTLSCDLLQLAVLAHTGSATELVLTGRLFGPTGCALIDGVDVKLGDMVVQHLDGGGHYVLDNTEQELARGAPVDDIANRCSSDNPSDRFDLYGIVVTGRVNGGSFTASCAQAAGGGYWPPALRLTCHKNVERAASDGDAFVMTQTVMGNTFTSSYLFGRSVHGPGGGLKTANESVRIIPKLYVPDPSVTAFDSTWHASVSEMGGPETESHIQLFGDGNVFGPKVCPPSSPTTPPPVLLARVTGNGEHGAYSTEIFARMCVATTN